jgi:hypothetical protein
LVQTFEELPRSLDALKATLSSEGSADGAADLVAEAACKEGLVDVLLTTLVHLDFQVNAPVVDFAVRPHGCMQPFFKACPM